MELVEGRLYDVVVRDVREGLGIIVLLEDDSTQLIHISNISNEYVQNVSDYVQENETYTALCQLGKKHPLELSLRHLNLVNRNRRTKVKGYNGNKKHRPSKSLDEMIEQSNQDYVDKSKILGRKDRYRRK